MQKVTVNDKFNFEIEEKYGEFKINGQDLTFDVVQLLEGNSYHILHNHTSYNVEILEQDGSEKSRLIKVNGNVYSTSIEDQFDLLLKKLGLDTGTANKIQEIRSPMPGLVLKVLVEEGTEVSKGDSLLVLEAMKMENVIKSPSYGVVSKIFVKQGDKTEKNAVLIQFK